VDPIPALPVPQNNRGRSSQLIQPAPAIKDISITINLCVQNATGAASLAMAPTNLIVCHVLSPITESW
jgi:hypothetical protein